MNRLKSALDNLTVVLLHLVAGTKAFIGPVADSIRGYVNLDELIRAAIAGIFATGSLAGAISGVEGDIDHILTPEAYQALTFGLVFFGDVYRRLHHGSMLARAAYDRFLSLRRSDPLPRTHPMATPGDAAGSKVDADPPPPLHSP